MSLISLLSQLQAVVIGIMSPFVFAVECSSAALSARVCQLSGRITVKVEGVIRLEEWLG